MVGLVQPSFAMGEISPSLYGRIDTPDYKSGLRTAENVFTHFQGGVSNRAGLEYVAPVRDRLIHTRLIPFSFSVSQSYVLEFGSMYFRIIREGAHLKESGLPIVSISNANPSVLVGDASYVNGDTVLIVGTVGTEELNGEYYILENKSGTSYNFRNERTGVLVDGTGLGVYVSGGTTEKIITVPTIYAGVDTDGIKFTQSADKMTLVHVNYPIQELVRVSALVWTIVDALLLGGDFNNGVGEYPGAVAYFEQRRVFGGSLVKPDTVFYSKVGAEDDFVIPIPILDDSPFVATMSSHQVNTIQHFVPRSDLAVFTSGSEWVVSAGSDVGFTPFTIRQKPQTEWGSDHIAPILIGGSVLHSNISSNVIRNFSYSSTSESYADVDITVLVDHMFDDQLTLEAWTVALTPYKIVWMVRSDGQALSLTYAEEQKVLGWCRHNTLGSFESIVSIYEETDNEHAVYCVVKRFIDGKYFRYIERMHTRTFSDVRDSFFVDSGLSYDVPFLITGISKATECIVTVESHGFEVGDLIDFSDIPSVKTSSGASANMVEMNGFRYEVSSVTVDTFNIIDPVTHVPVDTSTYNEWLFGGKVRKAVSLFRGIAHLEGETVSVLADGNVLHSRPVVDGEISLDRPASRVHVGLAYQSNVETLDVIVSDDSGTYQNKMKKVTEIAVRFKKSRGLFYGTGEDDLVEMKQRTDELMGQPTRLSSKVEELIMPASWNTVGRVYMRQDDPLPMTVLSISANVEMGR